MLISLIHIIFRVSLFFPVIIINHRLLFSDVCSARFFVFVVSSYLDSLVFLLFGCLEGFKLIFYRFMMIYTAIEFNCVLDLDQCFM